MPSEPTTPTNNRNIFDVLPGAKMTRGRNVPPRLLFSFFSLNAAASSSYMSSGSRKVWGVFVCNRIIVLLEYNSIIMIMPPSVVLCVG